MVAARSLVPRHRVFDAAKHLRAVRSRLSMIQEPDATTLGLMDVCNVLADALIDLQIQIEAERREETG